MTHYLPPLPPPGAAAHFFRIIRGKPVPSSGLMAPITLDNQGISDYLLKPTRKRAGEGARIGGGSGVGAELPSPGNPAADGWSRETSTGRSWHRARTAVPGWGAIFRVGRQVNLEGGLPTGAM